MTNPAIPVLLMALCIVIIFCAWAIYNLLEQIHDVLQEIRHCEKRIAEEIVDDD